MFGTLSEANLRRVARRMRRVEFSKGDVLMHQGESQEHMYVVTSGTVRRERYEYGRIHDTETLGATHSLNTVGALHLLRCEPTYATARCESPIVAYRLSTDDLDALLNSPSIAKEVVFALTREIKRQSMQLRTPLLDQHSLQFPIVPTSIAAAIESFYRSMLNSWLNYRLTGQAAALFPNMHVQLPTRVVYINGFKILRQVLDERVHPEEYSHPEAVRWVKAVIPGLAMTPVSSVLEACNAGHSNPEPLAIRWMRGVFPRAGREVIFGIGLNQLSEYCEERVPVQDPIRRSFFGSLTAGIICGYLSHVPHNLSTLKLLHPEKSYMQHTHELIRNSYLRVPRTVPKPARWATAAVLAFAAPAGLMVRTTQIAGSFCIINGVIAAMSRSNNTGDGSSSGLYAQTALGTTVPLRR